jgi:hypothetical protein
VLDVESIWATDWFHVVPVPGRFFDSTTWAIKDRSIGRIPSLGNVCWDHCIWLPCMLTPTPSVSRNTLYYTARLEVELCFMHAAPCFAHASYTLSLQNKFHSHTLLQTSVVDLLRAQITEKNSCFFIRDYYRMKRRDRYIQR